MTKRLRVGVVGARGYTGRELCGRLLSHPHLDLVFVASNKVAGQPVLDVWPEFSALPNADRVTDLTFVAPSPADVAAAHLDVIFLALPNGHAAPYVAVAENATVIDLSADHRFDTAWTYGLVERHRQGIRGATRIANPGCYATGLQLAIAPFLDVVSAPTRVFGVSGYSGAGTTPSERNDGAVLRDNLLAYAAVGHVHEREATLHLGHAVHFMPHVASWFRGIHLTVDLAFARPVSVPEMNERLTAFADAEPLLRVSDAPPRVRDVVGTPFVLLGGATADEASSRGVLVAAIDNLAKGAAVQAIQNLNVARGFDEDCALEFPLDLATIA